MTQDLEQLGNSGTHVPVLLEGFLKEVYPIEGNWLDGTFGSGGYSKALITAGANKVIALDCDPEARKHYSSLPNEYCEKIVFLASWFGNFDQKSEIKAYCPLDGVVFDLGVSSAQFDQDIRGFSFNKDGPLDMRMSQKGTTAAELVNRYSESQLADLFYFYGEERAARKIARGIINERKNGPITSTLQLANLIKQFVPVSGKGKIHPATKSFMALRLVVNRELEQLEEGLQAAARVLKAGGILAIVTFNSLEDRIVKYFLNPIEERNRYYPHEQKKQFPFKVKNSKPIKPSVMEITSNPRARSAKLRVGIRNCIEDELTMPELLPRPKNKFVWV